ncbi:hypothetical protein PIROE2DRAFT_2636, partial [Piromyces sp. E2]
MNSQHSSSLEASQSISDSNSSPYLALFNNTNVKSRKKPLLIQSQIGKEPLACDIIKQARASLKHPTRPITPLERRRSSFTSNNNSLFDSYNEIQQQNSSHLGTNFGVPFKSRDINTGILRNNGINNEIRLISRPYRLKPIDPASLKKLHMLQNSENSENSESVNVFDNSNISQNKINSSESHNNEVNNLNNAMAELKIHNSHEIHEMSTNKNQDRPLTTSELIVSLIRCPLSDFKQKEKDNLVNVINEVIKNHNFSMPTKSKINNWKTKPIHAQFIIDCCGHILS